MVSGPIPFQGRDPYLNTSFPDLQHSPFSPLLTELPIKRMDHQSAVPNGQRDESSDSVVYNIPIHVEGRDEVLAAPQRQLPADRRPQSPRSKPSERLLPTADATAAGRQVRPGISSSRQRSATPDTDDGPLRTIPVHMEPSKARDRSDSPAPAPKRKKTPQEQIEEANTQLAELREVVEKFSGSSSDKQYRYLDEMLTRLLISLDNMDTEGNEELRLARKQTVKSIQQCADFLESKVTDRPANQQQPADGHGTASHTTCELNENLADSNMQADATASEQQSQSQLVAEPMETSESGSDEVEPETANPPEDRGAKREQTLEQTDAAETGESHL